jgi:hypothetical protein
MVAPLGLGMGMPFPTGLRKLQARFAPATQWAWSLNASASVLGSVTAIMLAIHLGLRLTLILGGLMYVGAFALVRMISTTGQTAAPEELEVSTGE